MKIQAGNVNQSLYSIFLEISHLISFIFIFFFFQMINKKLQTRTIRQTNSWMLLFVGSEKLLHKFLQFFAWSYFFIICLCKFVYAFQKLCFSIIRQMSQPHSFTNVQLFRQYFRCFWIDLDVLYCIATLNLTRKPFLMVSWHIPVFLWWDFKFKVI